MTEGFTPRILIIVMFILLFAIWAATPEAGQHWGRLRFRRASDFFSCFAGDLLKWVAGFGFLIGVIIGVQYFIDPAFHACLLFGCAFFALAIIVKCGLD